MDVASFIIGVALGVVVFIAGVLFWAWRTTFRG
jgi:nitrogen fixation-related uncharacterized protein